MSNAKQILTLKLIGAATLVIIILGIVGCDDDTQGIDLSIPTEPGIEWEYELWRTDLNDSTQIGSLTVANVGQIDFEGRSDILRQRNIKYTTSSEEDSTVSSSYLDVSGDFEFELFANDFYGIYHSTLRPDILDTLTQNETEGPEFQNFFDYQPEWVVLARYDESTNSSYNVHEPQTFYLDFRLRGHQITGSVKVSTSGLLLGFESINVPLRDSIFTYKIRHSTHFDFNVSKDTVDLPTFRETLKLTTWYHPEAGIVKKYRSPIAFDVPSIPSRDPSIYIPGEVWGLKDISGFSL